MKNNKAVSAAEVLANFIVPISGCIVWLISAGITNFLLSILANVPFLFSILYWPADGPWAYTIIYNILPVELAGRFVLWSLRESERKWGAKIFAGGCILFAIVNVLSGIYMNGFQLYFIVGNIAAAGTAAIIWAGSDE